MLTLRSILGAFRQKSSDDILSRLGSFLRETLLMALSTPLYSHFGTFGVCPIVTVQLFSKCDYLTGLG